MADRSSSTDSAGKKPAGEAPGLGEQFGRTKRAFFGLIASHIDLAKAEFSEIGGEIKRAAALGGIALYLLFMAGAMMILGMLLFLGEALFGSMGWGVLTGTEFLLALTALLIFAIIDLGWRRAMSAFVVALGIGLVIAGVVAVNWSWVTGRYVGEPSLWLHLLVFSIAFGCLAAVLGSLQSRRAAIGMFVAGVVVGIVLRLVFGVFASTAAMVSILASMIVVGALGAVLAPGTGREPKVVGLVVGAFVGILIGLVGGAGPDGHVVAAMGVATFMAFWPIVAAFFVFRHGIDMAKLRARFVPVQTIATTKETIEWVREQLPHARKS